jgi:AraC-like DNA-binding protein
MPRKPHRQVFEDGRLLLPELRAVGWNSSKAARDTRLAGHTHPDAFEVCYIGKGGVEWWAKKQTYEVGPGEVYVTRPNEPHGGVNAVIQPSDIYWVQVAPEPAMARRMRAMRLRHFPASPAVPAAFERLMNEHRRRDGLSGLAAQAALSDLLVTVLRDHAAALRRREADEATRSPEIRRAMQWMRDRIEEDYAIADAAKVAGLSPTQFHERFRREVGHAPGAWRTRERVRLAKQLLRRPGLTITDVAMRAGFTTSQYFATTFKNMVGLTPREYRALASPRPQRPGTNL